jgi:hypothetical protein
MTFQEDFQRHFEAFTKERVAKLAENITRNNALMERLEAGRKRTKPTRMQRLNRWFWAKRRAVGFWIAGFNDPEDYDW